MAAESSEAGTSGDPDSGGKDEFLPGFPTFNDYSKALVSQVMTATKSVSGLPQEGDDYDYYASFPSYKTFCSKMVSRIDRIVSRVIRHQQLPCYWGVEQEGTVTEGSLLEEKLETLVEANDMLLERASVLLDEASGLRKNIDQPLVSGSVQQGTAEVASWNVKRDGVRKQMGKFGIIHSRNVPRPQVRFQDQIDNSNSPFIPRLKEKPNAKVPLPDVYERLANPTSLNALIANAKEWAGSEAWAIHPYQHELTNFEPCPEQLEMKDPQLPGSNEDTPLTHVDSLEKLEALKRELKSVKEFAIDLEHHSYRTFLGFTCLMQISTRFHDYLIDTLELRHHMHILLDPFTDPGIVKVMHGAEFDIVWMQRDFGLYIVNMFDTGQAGRVLQLPKLSLSFLLHYCCGVQADKQYQLADWRIRPLPEEMVRYAREDTHHLLYIYDRMKNELIRRSDSKNDRLTEVLKRSRDICLKLYKKPTSSDTDYLKLYSKHKRKFNSQQLHCLQLVFTWRDQLARQEDESTGYVLPNHMLFQIAEILPREMGGVLACCNPVPTLLRQQQQEVFLLIQKARESPITNVPPTFPSHEIKTQQDHFVDGGLTQRVTSGQDENSEKVSPIKITGPPVKVAVPIATVFKPDSSPPLSEDIVQKLKKVKQSFPDILDQFQEAQEMTPGEVLIQQQLAYEALAALNRTVSDSLHQPDKPVTVAMDTEVAGTGSEEVGGKGRGKKRLSVREMGQQESPLIEKPAKKVRLSRETPSKGDFQPFQYEGSKYTDFTPSATAPMEVYDPHSRGGRGNGGHGSVPRSRLNQKSSHKSQTYTSHSRRGRQPSWPRH